MRIIAGKYRRRPLLAPPGEETRPTTDRVRESIFNLLYNYMEWEEEAVLDLFAGTGALALEALSRGAQHAVLVELNLKAMEFAKKNIKSIGVEAQTLCIVGNALSYIKRVNPQSFDLILADPPYDLPELADLPELLLPLLKENGILALEHDERHDFSEHLNCLDSRKYGRTIVSLFGGEIKS
jgi:16S rRNA (guanine966-N2)-methyltransferase